LNLGYSDVGTWRKYGELDKGVSTKNEFQTGLVKVGDKLEATSSIGEVVRLDPLRCIGTHDAGSVHQQWRLLEHKDKPHPTPQ
jgi:hypothetical protein